MLETAKAKLRATRRISGPPSAQRLKKVQVSAIQIPETGTFVSEADIISVTNPEFYG